jgi:hypothetical protein
MDDVSHSRVESYKVFKIEKLYWNVGSPEIIKVSDIVHVLSMFFEEIDVTFKGKAAKKEGIVSGYPDGKFYPEKNVSFVEAGKILALAYKQSVDQYSPDWYEPYARALESSKAIPPSISNFRNAFTLWVVLAT